MRFLLLPLLLLTLSGPAKAEATAADYRADAQQMPQQIADSYAYLDRFENGAVPITPILQEEAEHVDDARSLLKFAERMLLVLRDHHAITGSSLADSWAVVPTYADLWITYRGGHYLVDAVREGSPAQMASVVRGMRLTGIGDKPAEVAVAAFWDDLGYRPRDREALGFAARVLVAGRRDRPRALSFAGPGGSLTVNLPNLYMIEQEPLPPVTVTRSAEVVTIRFNNSLGDTATIAAFDAAMEEADDAAELVLDLTDTPSGGNTVIARAVMGWFALAPTPYQLHTLPAEQRRTGIARQWAEYVLPRAGKAYNGNVRVRVGRWTGSMGEGLAIGLRELGANLEGGAMAGLRGAIYDLQLDRTGFVYKLPVERLSTIEGVPREAFRAE